MQINLKTYLEDKMFRREFNNYVSDEWIKAEYGITDAGWDLIKLDYYEGRAQILISKLEPLDDALPLTIKMAIWKLQVITFTAQRIADPYNLNELNLVEEIENCAIKVQMNDYSAYSEVSACGALSVEIIDGNKLPITYVVAIEMAPLTSLVAAAKKLKDKVLVKDLVRDILDKTRFHRECNELGLNPRDEDEMEVRLMWEVSNG